MPDRQRDIRDSQIHRMIDGYHDEHPEPGPDEDSLRAYFAGRLYADWPAQRAHSIGYAVGYAATVVTVLVGVVLVLAVVWSVTA